MPIYDNHMVQNAVYVLNGIDVELLIIGIGLELNCLKGFGTVVGIGPELPLS